MRRFLPFAVLGFLALSANAARADAFDLYLNQTLAKLTDSPNAREIKQLTPDDVGDNDRVLPGLPYAFVVVKTNEGRNAKLLVQIARQKVEDKLVPFLLVERYVTFKEGEEQTRLVENRNVALYPGFRLSLDRGQIVPESLGGDLRFVVDGEKIAVEPVGMAKLYLVTKPVPDLAPPKGGKIIVGDKFEPRYFNGTYRLHEDGRRSGKLILKVEEDGTVSGAFYSDRDGQKYEVRGQVGTPVHSIQLTIVFPRTEQTLRGMMFTGDAAAIAGTARMNERETGFYAVRIEE
jgi:hypothetical protein